MNKRILTVLMAFVMTLAFMPFFSYEAYASTNGHSEAEAVAWARNMADSQTYCGECVALIQKYYEWLGVSVPNTNANTYANDDHIPSGWYVDNTPSLGAVYVESNYSPGHVSIVVGIDSAGTLTTVDSNVEGSSVGQYNAQYFPWTTGRKKSDYAGVAGKSFVHPDFTSAPPTAQLSIDRKYYNPGDNVTFHFSGNNTNGKFTLGVYKEFDRYKTIDVNSNTYSIQFNDVASYSAYMTSYGTGGGYADSNWVDWQVLPLTAELRADKTKCNVNDKVTLSFHGNNSNTFAGEDVTLAVWCNGEYVVHKNVTGSNYEVVCDKPGEYKSYMTAYGGGELKDSNWVYWTVSPLTAELRADKTKCNVNDKVTLSFHGNNSNTFAGEYVTLAVLCNGEYVVHKNVTGSNYEVVCDKPGEYKSYMTAYGGGTYKDSNWVNWTVYPSTTATSINKPDLPSVKIAKPKAAKKSVTVRWKKVSKKNREKIARIQIQYSTDKKFKKNVKTVYGKKSATSKKITKLKSKKTYYVRIRAYRKSGGVIHISKWSATMPVKVK